MHRCGLLPLVILFLGIFVGCGDSDEFVEPVAAPNVGTIQVQVRSTRFTAQTTADPVYVVTVMNQQGQTITIEIFQQPPPTEIPEVAWRLPSVPVGIYDVQVTGQRDDVPFVRYEVSNVPVHAGQTTIIGDGTGASQGFTVVSLEP